MFDKIANLLDKVLITSGVVLALPFALAAVALGAFCDAVVTGFNDGYRR